MDTEELLTKYAAGERNFSNANLRSADLTRATLNAADLSEAILSEVILTQAELGEANLSRTILTKADLTEAVLAKAKLTGAILTEAELSRVNLYDLYDAFMLGVNLTEANVTQGNLGGANLSQGNLSGVNLSGANLAQANLSKADLSGATLSGVILSQTNLSGATMPDSCVYVNGETGQFWVIDYRLYDPDGDGQSKLDHVAAMLNGVIHSKQLPFTMVLMDSWYATQKLMGQIDQLEKLYYCPLKTNRRVDDSGGAVPYMRVVELVWSDEDLQQGKLVKIRGFPKDKKVKLFRVTVSTNRTEFVATNDLSQADTDVVQDVCGIRWKIEEFHRELKQLTGVEACQCRKARIQRNHIACALLVWSRLKTMADQSGRTIYQIKHGMLSDYLIEQLKHPSVQMSLA